MPIALMASHWFDPSIAQRRTAWSEACIEPFTGPSVVSGRRAQSIPERDLELFVPAKRSDEPQPSGSDA
jgi:hypothetical protein